MLIMLFMSAFFVQTSLATQQHNVKPQYTYDDSLKVVALLTDARRQPDTTNYIIYFARQLRGLPYVAHTLEVNKSERLVINLRQLDCTTYVENVLALTMCMKQKTYTFGGFCRNLQTLRYTSGSEPAYTSRLHYFTTWIEDNTAVGICREIQSPNPPFTAVQIVMANYMTRNINKYKMLAANPDDIPGIRKMEKDITGRTYRYIPKAQLTNTKSLRRTVKDGDVIAIITNISGLDTQHIGIAVWHDDGLHLLNASSIRHKVVEEPMTLRQYLYRHKTMPGIRVIRIL